MFKNKRVLITGATGSWGYELVKKLLEKDPLEIRIFSRNESRQVDMMRYFSDNRLKFVIGDIKERESIIQACQNIDYVFHLAALKHVPVCEDQPLEALKTNVHGTQNVIDAAIMNHVKKVVYISTDKAADPSNFYGLSKAMGERLIIHANMLSKGTKFVTVRGGNVLGTNGSVIHVFKKQIQENREVGITDFRMTRFFLTIEEAIDLLFMAFYKSIGGEIFVMKMPTCSIKDLAEVLIEDSGLKDVIVKEQGIRPGEKIHEILFSENESEHTVHYNEDYYVVLPSLDITGLKEQYDGFEFVDYGCYSSKSDLMSKAELKDLLLKGGFLS